MKNGAHFVYRGMLYVTEGITGNGKTVARLCDFSLPKLERPITHFTSKMLKSVTRVNLVVEKNFMKGERCKN